MVLSRWSLLLLVGVFGTYYAAGQANYSVVSLMPNASMAVVVDDQVYSLNKSNYPLIFTGTAPEPSEDGGFYYAVVEGDQVRQREAFMRHNVTNAINVFNRSTEVYPMESLPQFLQPLEAIRRIDSDLHHYNEIATLHFSGDPADFNLLHSNLSADYEVETNMTYIRGDDVQTFSNVTVDLSGRSSRLVPKLSYGVKIPKGQDLYGYRRLKLRALGTDPSYIRESIAYRVLEAAGLPTTKFSYVRVFINDSPIGLFGMIENFKDPWLRNEFGNGDEDYSQGTLYTGNLGIGSTMVPDLRYLSDNASVYGQDELYKIKEKPSEGEADFEALMELTKALNVSSVDDWDKFIDMESLLRNLALEVLLGFSDGFIDLADNYHIYQLGANATKFIWVASDLDLTLGNAVVRLEDMLTGDYNTFPGFDKRPVLMKLFNESPKYRARFEELLLSMAENLVTPEVLNPVIDDTINMIRADVDWDLTLPRVSSLNMTGGFVSLIPSFTTGSNVSVLPTTDYSFPVDMATLIDAGKHWFGRPTLTFDEYVNGPTGMLSLSGVREFIANQSTATTEFFKNR